MALQGNFLLLLVTCLLGVLVPYALGEGHCEAYHLKENTEKTLELTEAESWTDSRCDLFSKSTKNDEFTLIGKQPANWPQDLFCLAASYPDVGDTYEFEVNLWNHVGRNGNIQDGNPGIAFNIKDENNYDYVYFRLGDSDNSFQTGYVEKGVNMFVEKGACPDGPPQGRTWFNVKLDRIEGRDDADLYLDGKITTKSRPHFDGKGNVGVLVANGFDSIIRFKDATVTGSSVVTKPMPVIGPKSCKISDNKVSGFTVKKCELKNISTTEFVLTSSAASARALTKQFYRAFNTYWISVGMYFPSSTWAGLVFNARDSDNFEQIMFRCGTYKYGLHYHIANGALTNPHQKLDYHSTIIPTCNTWYNVKINIRGEQVHTYVNDVRIGKIDSFRSPGGHVGIFHHNAGTVLHFKNFEIHVPGN